MTFTTLLWKEVKDLVRDPHVLVMILLPAMIYGVMGEAMGASAKQALEKAKHLKVVIVDEDRGFLAKVLEEVLSKALKVVRTPEEADAVVVIPRGFTENVTKKGHGEVLVKLKATDVSLALMASAGAIEGAVEGFNSAVVSVATGGRLNTTRVIKVRTYVALPTGLVSLEELGAAFNSLTLLIIAPLMVAGYAAVVSAASMAVEKEERTFETLLTLPVPRTHIVLAKLLASAVVAVLGTASVAAGIYWYTSRLAALSPIGTAALTELLGARGVALILASTLVLLLLSCGVGLTAGMVCQSMRSAQSVASSAFMIAFLVGMPLMMGGLPPQPYRTLVALIPFSAPVVAVKSVMLGDDLAALTSIASHLLYAVALSVLTAKLVSSERLIVGWRAPKRG